MTGENIGESVGGAQIGGDHLPVPTHAPGRVCQRDDCDALLSIYNSDNYCALHASEAGVPLVHDSGGPRRRGRGSSQRSAAA